VARRGRCRTGPGYREDGGRPFEIFEQAVDLPSQAEQRMPFAGTALILRSALQIGGFIAIGHDQSLRIGCETAQSGCMTATPPILIRVN
jgi:hypothetical protein